MGGGGGGWRGGEVAFLSPLKERERESRMGVKWGLCVCVCVSVSIAYGEILCW